MKRSIRIISTDELIDPAWEGRGVAKGGRGLVKIGHMMWKQVRRGTGTGI